MPKGKVTTLMEKNVTFDHAVNYLINSFARKGIRLISIPVLTYLLTPADYGIINVFSANVELAAILLTLNANVGVGRYYFEKGKDDFGSLLFVSMLISFSLLLFFWVIMSWNAAWIGEWLALPTLAIYFIVPAAMLIVLSNFHLSVFRAAGRSKELRNLAIQRTYVQFILAVLIIILLKNDLYMGQIWSIVLSTIIFGFIILKRLSPYIQIGIKKENIKYLLSYSLPLLPAYLSSFLLSYVDRIMLNDIEGYESAGLYSLAYNIAGLQYMISNAIMNAWTPRYFTGMNDGDYKNLDIEATKIFRMISVATFGLVVFGQYVGMLLSSQEFHSGLKIIPVVVCGQLFVTLTVLYKNSISFSKKTIVSTIAVITSAIINVVLNYFFIPKYGIEAAAWTTYLSYLVQAGIMIFLVRNYVKVHSINPRLLMPVFILISSVSLIVIYIDHIDFSTLHSILLKITLFGLVTFFMLREEIKYIYIKFLKS